MPLSEIVKLTITRETSTVARAGFGVPQIIGPNVNVNGRFAFFTDAQSAIAATVGVSTLEAAQINAFFAQQPSVAKIALGALQAAKVATFTGPMTAGSIKATVNGVVIDTPFDTDQDTTLDNMAISIAAEADVATAVNVTGTVTVTPAAGKAVGVVYDVTGATGITAVVTSSTQLSETYTTALDLILASNPDWYGLIGATRVLAEQKDLADWTEINKKFLSLGSADSNIIDQNKATDVTSIAWYLQSKSYVKSQAIFGLKSATEGNDAAALGKMLPFDPGTYTQMLMTLAGITVDILTPTQSINARDKNANVYQPIGGQNVLREGTVGGTEFADTMIFIDFLQSTIEESVFAAMAGVLKVPFTQVGIDAIGAAIDNPLQTGQNRGGISPDEFDDAGNRIGGFVVNLPRIQDVDPVDKANRCLPDIKFTAFLSGAIHEVQIDGIVTV